MLNISKVVSGSKYNLLNGFNNTNDINMLFVVLFCFLVVIFLHQGFKVKLNIRLINSINMKPASSQWSIYAASVFLHFIRR